MHRDAYFGMLLDPEVSAAAAGGDEHERHQHSEESATFVLLLGVLTP